MVRCWAVPFRSVTVTVFVISPGNITNRAVFDEPWPAMDASPNHPYERLSGQRVKDMVHKAEPGNRRAVAEKFATRIIRVSRATRTKGPRKRSAAWKKIKPEARKGRGCVPHHRRA